MEKIKKLFTLVMAIMLVAMGTVSSIYAANASMPEAEQMTPRYATSCPNASKHLMKSSGSGAIYVNNKLFTRGVALQCQYCNAALVCENSPFWSTGLGYYALAGSATYTIDQGIIEIYLKSNPTYNETMNSDPVIRGMEFWY